MKFLIALLILIIVAGLLLEPGYLMIAYGRYTLEASLIAMLVVLLLLMLTFRLLAKLIWWLNPRHWRSRRG